MRRRYWVVHYPLLVIMAACGPPRASGTAAAVALLALSPLPAADGFEARPAAPRRRRRAAPRRRRRRHRPRAVGGARRPSSLPQHLPMLGRPPDRPPPAGPPDRPPRRPSNLLSPLGPFDARAQEGEIGANAPPSAPPRACVSGVAHGDGHPDRPRLRHRWRGDAGRRRCRRWTAESVTVTWSHDSISDLEPGRAVGGRARALQHAGICRTRSRRQPRPPRADQRLTTTTTAGSSDPTNLSEDGRRTRRARVASLGAQSAGVWKLKAPSTPTRYSTAPISAPPVCVHVSEWDRPRRRCLRLHFHRHRATSAGAAATVSSAGGAAAAGAAAAAAGGRRRRRRVDRRR